MNYIYTKKQILNMKKAIASVKKSKGYTVDEFLRLSRQWIEEANPKKAYVNRKKI